MSVQVTAVVPERGTEYLEEFVHVEHMPALARASPNDEQLASTWPEVQTPRRLECSTLEILQGAHGSCSGLAGGPDPHQNSTHRFGTPRSRLQFVNSSVTPGTHGNGELRVK